MGRHVRQFAAILTSVTLCGGTVAAQTRPLQESPDVFSILEGDWTGTGVLLDGPGTFAMRWEVMESGAVELTFSNSRTREDGTSTPILAAHATYVLRGSRVLGTWVDDRPQRIAIDGSILDSMFIARWTAEGESGRTEYVVRSSDEVVVRDFVDANGSERLFAQATYHRKSGASPATTAELRGLYEADQADRRHSSPPTPEMWEAITKRDGERRARVLQLLRADSVVSAQDLYHAAMVLQHGQGSEDVLIAHVLATAAAYLGDERGEWLSAAALDRYLLRSRAPQRLGTQYVKASTDDPYEIDASQPWSQGPYEAWLPDSIRRIFHVEALSEQADRVRSLNGSTGPGG